MAETKPVSYALAPRCELRLEVSAEEKVTISLLTGTCELYGTELSKGTQYTFSDWQFALFTWHGCQLELTVSGAISIYESDQTPMVSYVNAHAALDNLRVTARNKNIQGPRVMIVGGDNAGKATFARTLLSYAVRAGTSPCYVDLDVARNTIAIPGSIAATPIDHVIAPSCTVGPQFTSPQSYYFGHTNINKGTELYKTLCEQLAGAVTRRLEGKNGSSGLVIKAAATEEEDLLLFLIKLFEVDVVLVLGHEKLHSMLQRREELKDVTVAHLDKSPGVVQKTQRYRDGQRRNTIRKYFYGMEGSLAPHQKQLGFNEITIFRAGTGSAVSTSMLPIGMKALLDPNKPMLVTITPELLHCVLGVSYATTPEQLLKESVAGYLYVTAIDLKAQTITVLSPSTGPLPSHLLLTGSIKWSD